MYCSLLVNTLPNDNWWTYL